MARALGVDYLIESAGYEDSSEYDSEEESGSWTDSEDSEDGESEEETSKMAADGD